MSIKKVLFILPLFAYIPVRAQMMGLENNGNKTKTSIGIEYECSGGAISDYAKVHISHELSRSRQMKLTANANYFNILQCDFVDKDMPVGISAEQLGMNKSHQYGQFGLSGLYHHQLFGKPLMVLGMVNADWGIGRLQRVSGLAMGIIMLKTTKETQFGIGPLVLINSTTKIPAFPVFFYRHRYSDKLSIDLYGAMFGLNYKPTVSDHFTIGGDINTKAFYFKPKTEGLPKYCRYHNTSFRPSIKYRRKIADRLYGEMQGGIVIKMSNRVNGVTGTKEYFTIGQKVQPFAHVGMNYSF
ncbi:MAG: hypothetical protein K2H97_00790 [Prevotella sp.]|nr:hypothetical protein [Prevotella sp.]